MLVRAPSPPRPFQHEVIPRAFEGLCLIESHCPFCRAFIAASPSVKLIQIAESFHSCRE
jgi:hypothetical protein